MRVFAIIAACLVALAATSGHAETYRSKHFIVEGDVDARYIQFVLANAEAYCGEMEANYYSSAGDKPVIIYFSERQSDTQRLFRRHGIAGQPRYGLYSPDPPSIYMHRLLDTGDLTGWGTLFHEMTHHFVAVNYENAPAWFDEGLATILGEQARIVRGKVDLGKPNPWREHALREMIEDGFRIDIEKLVSLSRADFNKNTASYHPLRALFYWLHHQGKLQTYMRAARESGYGLRVLEEVVGRSRPQINAALAEFIKSHCYAGAYVYEGRQANDKADIERAYLQALGLKPDYRAARVELARHYFHTGNSDKSREYLAELLNCRDHVECFDAAELMGHILYAEKDFAGALEHYLRARENSQYNEYAYGLCFWMANCHHSLNDYDQAFALHHRFLEENWEPQRLSMQVEFSRQYASRNVR